MRFSVIIPVYNVEDYLAECLDSVMNQSCQDFEVILIDDGSTDKSGEICDAYARQYPEQIRLIHQENQGAAKTRITGLNSASGEICIFVDSDDVLRKDALEKIDEMFRKMDCDMVLYGASRDAEFCSDGCVLPFENGRCFEGSAKKELYRLMVETGNLSAMWMKAARKSLYDEVICNYDSSLRIAYGEDLHLSMPLLTKAQKIVWLDEKLYFYRPRAGSICNSFNPGIHRDMKFVRLAMEAYIAIWDITDYYPVFYTKVVSNWLSALKSLLKNQKTMEKETVISLLQELSTDNFFRTSYDRMIPERFSCRDRLLIKWLYDGKQYRIRMLGNIFYSAKQKRKSKHQRLQNG